MSELDDFVLGEIAKIKTGEIAPPAASDPGYDAKIERLRERISRLLDLYADGVSVPQMKEKIQSMSAKIEELERKKAEHENALKTADAVELVESFGDVIKSRDFVEIRLLVGALIDRIVIDGDDIEIHWNFG